MPYRVDASLFNGEVDMLMLRLSELSSIVDSFVVVEANRTFTGQPRAVVAPSLAEQLAPYNVTVVTVTDMPLRADAWERETHLRNSALRGLEDVPSDALVTLSDADEIPNGEFPIPMLEDGVIAYHAQSFHYYNFNRRFAGRWFGSRTTTLATLRSYSPQEVRRRGTLRVKEGGWHFSYFGGVESIRAKLSAFSHTEYNRPPFNTAQHIQRQIEAGVDLFGREGHHLEYVAGTSHLPRSVQREPERYRAYFDPRENGSHDQESISDHAVLRPA